MKKILIILLIALLSANAAAQAIKVNHDIDTVSLAATLIVIGKGDNRAESFAKRDTSGFYTGVLYSDKEREVIGSESAINDSFIKQTIRADTAQAHYVYDDKPVEFEGVYYINKKDYDYSEAQKPTADKILQYSFYPKRISQDGQRALVFCKYALYEKDKQSGSGDRTNYSVSFNEEICSVPLNKSVSLNFLKKTFPEADTSSVMFVSHIWRKPTESDKYARSLPLFWFFHDTSYASAKEIKQSVRDPDFNKDILIDGEYLRTDNANLKILDKKDFYFADSLYYVYSGVIGNKGFLHKVYGGSIEAPFHIYSPKIEKAFENERGYKDGNIEYDIRLLPLDKDSSSYTFKMFVGRETFFGKDVYIKEIRFKVGEPVRIELDKPDGYAYTRAWNGKPAYQEIMKDYANNVHEYLILKIKPR